MKIDLKKLKYTDEEISIEVPACFLYSKLDTYFMILENEIISVTDNQVTVIRRDCYLKEWFHETARKAISGRMVSYPSFMAVLKSVQSDIEDLAGASELPTIFTQNKFRSIQKESL